MRSTHLLYQVAFDNFIGFGLVNMYLQAINYQYYSKQFKSDSNLCSYGWMDMPWVKVFIN